jgi:hypothetical protein
MKDELLAMLDARSHEATKHLHDKLRAIRHEFQTRGTTGSSMNVHAVMRACGDYMVAYVDGAIGDFKRSLESTEERSEHSAMRDSLLSRLASERDAVWAILMGAIGKSAAGLSNPGLTNYKAFDKQWDVLQRDASAKSKLIMSEVARAAPSRWERFVKRWQNKPAFVPILAMLAIIGAATLVAEAVQKFGPFKWPW